MGREPYAHYRHLIADDSESSVERFRMEHGGIVTAEIIAKGLLPYAVVSNWNFTLHDLDHSYRVCDNINIVLDMLPQDMMPGKKEVEILYQAALLHDIGMAFLSRDKERGVGVTHGQLSAIVLKTIAQRPYMNEGPSTLGSDEQIEALCWVVKSHCMELHNDEAPYFDSIDEIMTVDGEDIHLKMLCAILCIADGLDIGKKRIASTVHDILTDRELLVVLSDIVGSQSVPYLGKISRHHWEMESHTRVDLDKNGRTVIIEVESEEEKAEREKLKAYLEHYFGYLQMKVDVCIVMR